MIKASIRSLDDFDQLLDEHFAANLATMRRALEEQGYSESEVAEGLATCRAFLEERRAETIDRFVAQAEANGVPLRRLPTCEYSRRA